MGTLHAPKSHKDAWNTLIAAEFVGCKLEVPEKFIIGISNMTDEFLECNPTGKPPVLETNKGSIFDSNAIARYIAFGSDLMGSTPDERDLVDQWIGFSSFELDSNIMAWLLPIMGCATYIEAIEETCILNLKRGLRILNERLDSREFLVGNTVTLADIITACDLVFAFKHLTTKSFTSQFPHVEKYFWALFEKPEFKKVVAKIRQVKILLPVPYYVRPKKPKQLIEAKPIKEGP